MRLECSKELTPRDQMALSIVNGILASEDSQPNTSDAPPTTGHLNWYRTVAIHAYAMADAMIDVAWGDSA